MFVNEGMNERESAPGSDMCVIAFESESDGANASARNPCNEQRAAMAMAVASTSQNIHDDADDENSEAEAWGRARARRQESNTTRGGAGTAAILLNRYPNASQLYS